MLENNELYINPQIICRGSEIMLLKLNEGKPLYFTISKACFDALFKKAIEKDRGKVFENNFPFYIPNSFIEIHVNNDLSFLAKKVAIQVRKRKDERGVNIFVSNSNKEIGHSIDFSLFPDQDEYYNELHFKTKEYENNLNISIKTL